MLNPRRRRLLREHRRGGRRVGVLVGNSMTYNRRSVYVNGTFFTVKKCRGMPRRGDVILVAADPDWFDNSANLEVIYIVKRVGKGRVCSCFLFIRSLLCSHLSSCTWRRCPHR